MSADQTKQLTERLDINFALQAAGLGVWELDPTTNLINWDNKCSQLFGLTDKNQLTYKQALLYVHPDDRERIEQAVNWVMNPQSGGDYDLTHRTIGANDGQLRWVRFRGRCYFNEEGKILRFAGIAQEVTEDVQQQQLEASEARYRSLVMEAPVPTALLLGRELIITVANQPQLTVWAKGNDVIGLPLAQALPEMEGQPFLTILDEVFTTGIPYETHDNPANIVVDGVLRTYYFDFTFKPLRNSQGEVYAILAMGIDITQQVVSQKNLVTSEARFRSLIEEAPVATALFVGRELIITVANDRLLDYLGKDHSILGKPYRVAVPELRDQLFFDILNDVYITGEPFEEKEARVDLPWEGIWGTRYFHQTFTPLRDKGEHVYAVMMMAVEVTGEVLAKKALQESERNLRNLILKSPAAMCLYQGPQHTVEIASERMIEFWGRSADELLHKPMFVGLPEARNQGYEALLDHVYTTGEPYTAQGIPVNLPRAGGLETIYINLLYEPYRDAGTGRISGVIAVAIEVTEQVRSRQAVEEYNKQMQSLFTQAPVAIGILRGPQFIVELANPLICQVWNRSAGQLLGQPIFQVIKEATGQGFEERLIDVLQTGISFEGRELPVTLIRNGRRQTIFVNFVYQPLRAFEGGPTDGIVIVGTEVTEQVMARIALEDSQERLQLAIDSAGLGTWDYDPITDLILCSDRFANLFGFPPDAIRTQQLVVDAIVEEDRQRTIDAIEQALSPESGGFYDIEYSFLNYQTKHQHTIRAKGRAFFNGAGVAYRFIGTVVDITEQKRAETKLRESEAAYRTLSMALEQQVQQRTEELQVYIQDLQRSNQNLQQFAYIASHDLQEPLRKIQQFGDLLKDRYADSSDEQLDYLQRMQSAASRMSTLVRDLLSFSRISTQQDASEPVALSELVQAVLRDLELVINESGAIVNVDTLPVVQGDPMQLGHLFLNLLSNALKFHQPGSPPVIHVRAGQLSGAHLPAGLLPDREAIMYHRLDVVDNGIGFDMKYLDRIFQVFQRLHRKNEFAGTGIGLAICEKVVLNHGGAITATSHPGQGTTFSVYLPM